MKRSFLYLMVLTVLALMALVFVPDYVSQQGSEQDTLLLPVIAGQINDVDRVEVIAAGNSVVATMLRTDSGWALQQMAGYHANWNNIQALLAGLAQARVVTKKTDKEEYYSRLGVEDIDAEGAASILLNIGIAGQSTGILIGHQAQGRNGQYVRLQKDSTSLEIDRQLDVSSELLHWVDSAIIDINASEVAEVELIQPQGERLLLTKISADQTDFDFVGLPAEREIKSSWAVNSLGSVFSMLNMKSVRPSGGLVWDKAVRMRLLMFSGVEIIAELMEFEEQYLFKLQASQPLAEVVGKQASEDKMSAEQKEIELRAAKDTADMVVAINQKVEGWVYGIDQQKFDAMATSTNDVLKPLETP